MYEIPVLRHGIRRIYIKCVIRFTIQNGGNVSKLIFFPQKLIFCIKTSEIEHLTCKYIRVVIGSAAILIGFDPGL